MNFDRHPRRKNTGQKLYNKKNNKYPLEDDYANIDKRYRFFIGNIEKLPEKFHSKFDLIFSINCFEHIQRLPESLDKMYKALRVGGKLITIFAPIWSAFNGHHLPRITDKSSKTYNHDNSPIPPWGHLIMASPQMFKYLSGHVDKETAAKMVYYIYQSPFINRLFFEDYKQYFEKSDFEIERLEAAFPVKIKPDMQSTLDKIFSHNKQFANRGILFIARRSH